jgi:PAS domain S-box-containing protein
MNEDKHLPLPAERDDATLRDVLAKTTAAALAVSSAEQGRVFEDLAHALARILGVDAALIAEFSDAGRTRMHTLATVLDGRLLRSFEYEVALTPCRHIVGRESRFVASGVRPEFRPGTMFSELGFDSYAGYSLLGADGAQLGIIVALDRKPITDRPLTEALLKIFAVRAAAEIERGRAEASYRTIFDAAEDAIFVHDWETGAIVDVNDKAAQVYGYTRDQMRTLRVADFSSGEPPYTEDDALRWIALARQGQVVRFEWHRRNRDGSLHWDEVCLKPVHIAGRPHILAFTREITERKAALEALAQREEQYRSIFNASLDAMVLRDAQMKLVDANAAFLARHGVRREDVIGTSGMMFITPPCAAAVEALLRTALAGSGGSTEAQTVAHDGAVLDIEVRAVPMQYDGRPHVLSIARDITERKRAEQALRASEEQYRTVFNASADALILWDSQLRRVDVNPAYERIFGWAREEVVGQRFEHRNVPHEYADRRLALVRRALAGEMCHAELESVRKSGERFGAEIHAIPIQYRGEPHVLSIVRDITERRRADEERARLEAQLRQAQKMEAIGQLTGGISHDFNNILASIMGYVVLAAERAQDAGDDKTAGYLEHALDSCRRARDLIQQMLTFSRGRRGEPRPLKLCELVQDAAPLLRSSMPSTISLDFDCDRDVPPVLADEIQAGQVLLNLAINGRDAIGTTGTLRIGVRPLHASGLVCTSCRRTVDGRFVELTVADDGCGIEPAVVDRIFEPFFSTKDTGKGSGMGLSMVHGIVHEHGGHVVVETAPGRGSVFRVLLPALLGDDVVASAEPAARRPAKARKLRGRVLLVDDEDSVRNVMQERLRTWGLDVEVASDAATARAAFDAADGAIDAVITDQTMPHETGLDLARALRSRRADLPVILYTGYADELTAAQAQAAGVRMLLRKPVEPAALRAALERVLPAE